MRSGLLRAGPPLAMALMTGCLGRSVDRAVMGQIAPGMLATPDMPMLCGTGAAMTPLVTALGSARDDTPERAAILTWLAAGMCSEIEAWDAELERRQALFLSRRALEAQDTDAAEIWSLVAQDAGEREARAHLEAAQRNHQAWLTTASHYGVVQTEGDPCPKLDTEDDELVFLMGTTAGLLAVIHDGATGRMAGVSTGIIRQAERGAACVSDDRWWGVPSAIQASVWTGVPGAAPEGSDPWQALELAAVKGEGQGVWLARALQAITVGSQGGEIRAVVEAHSAALDELEPDPRWGLLNDYSYRMIRHESDRIWMDEVGKRTPMGAFGSFYQAPKAIDLSIFDLLPPEEPNPSTPAEPGAPVEPE